jgi:HEAT repeat protein
VEPLIYALRHDKDGGVRTAAIWALERIGHPDAVPALVDALMDATLREDAARVLKKLGDSRATDALMEGLQASNWIVRRHAAEALGKIGDPRCLDSLIQALADEDWLVRRNAAESLARFKDSRAIDPLVPLLEDENEMVRDTAEGALASLGWTPGSSAS